MDPRYTSIARTPIGIALRCEGCKSEIDELRVPSEGVSVFELVRSSLRHLCDGEPPVELTDEEVAELNQIAENMRENPDGN